MILNVNVFKALSNQTRLDILKWLKNPEEEITSVSCETVRFMMTERGGICVQDLVKKAGLAQSTVSSYLSMMEKCDLLVSERHGKWTYYRRNEAGIQSLRSQIREEL
ncbi:metalloregulator ArsR/SmtB family transcription factor [Lactiplantibacillus sp. WILCCON 0030]|uniref:Metalloregulator ArsR/SmtB family transcription factor n=1 Tax=Lactiplantibacillus brownii TaxID=3069269 RepID=A0ABU1ABV1_9LACO|nr:metalloregulator ArsR/SmtB family transcription factor [Lactiplantibacillus brownii]MDQ7938383.1 metalloregulator ArsR/SmtB family transcription factor [Lactiplantibacillus brownii]